MAFQNHGISCFNHLTGVQISAKTVLPWIFHPVTKQVCFVQKCDLKVHINACSNSIVTTLVTDLIEEESRDLMIGVSIRDLGKTYSNGKVALRNLRIDFYEDQITSFLGHNGAGKTTTM